MRFVSLPSSCALLTCRFNIDECSRASDGAVLLVVAAALFCWKVASAAGELGLREPGPSLLVALDDNIDVVVAVAPVGRLLTMMVPFGVCNEPADE